MTLRLLLLLGLLAGCAASRQSGVPLVTAAEELKTYDEQVIRLVGTYRPLATPWNMRERDRHVGFAAIWVGDRYVRLGNKPRPASERVRLTGKTVVATGRLVMRPPLAYPPHVAQPLPPPTLYPEGPIRVWRSPAQ